MTVADATSVSVGADWIAERIKLSLALALADGHTVHVELEMTLAECDDLRNRLHEAAQEMEMHLARRLETVSGAV